MSDNNSSADYIIYTDGACSGNPGPGGWGAVLMSGDERREIKGGERDTTNNRMELLAAIKALEAISKNSTVDLHTDSQYTRKGITEWIYGWKKRGWKTAAKKPVKNADLWRQLDELRNEHNVTWYWVKGHAGHPENECADELARTGLQDTLAGKSLQDDGIFEREKKQPFVLNDRLEVDTFAIIELNLCTIRLLNDKRYPWILLIPKLANINEITQLSQTDSRQLMDEMMQVSAMMEKFYSFDKLNIGALGNLVEQLHIHIIARSKTDPAWPGPVWGHSKPEKYTPAEAKALCKKIANELGD